MSWADSFLSYTKKCTFDRNQLFCASYSLTITFMCIPTEQLVLLQLSQHYFDLCSCVWVNACHTATETKWICKSYNKIETKWIQISQLLCNLYVKIMLGLYEKLAGYTLSIPRFIYAFCKLTFCLHCTLNEIQQKRN